MYKDTIVITNRKLVKGDYLAQLRKVAALHPYGVILREKDLTEEAYEALAKEVIKICEAEQVPCFLHSKYKIAERLECKNIHLSIPALLEYKEEIKITHFQQISVSCHSLEDVQIALEYGATTIVLGTIFETDCKKGLKGRGTGFVEEIASYCKEQGDIPVFAIGGISPKNLELVKKAGARGGCMMSYMMTL